MKDKKGADAEKVGKLDSYFSGGAHFRREGMVGKVYELNSNRRGFAEKSRLLARPISF